MALPTIPGAVRFNHLTPAPPAGAQNVVWQFDTATGPAVLASAYVPSSTRQGFIQYYLAGKPVTANANGYVDVPSNLTSFQIPGNFSGAYGKPGTNPTATATVTFYKNGSSFGTLSISTGGVYTWSTTAGAAETFTPGSDELSWTLPTTDATLSDVRFAIPITLT